jgi:hypothetical protein
MRHNICSPPLVEDEDHDEKSWNEIGGNWRKLYLQGYKVGHMRNGLHEWVIFLGPWQ